MKLLKKHFRATKFVQKSKATQFCESCLNENPCVDQGYTCCCNELVISDKYEAINRAKASDIFDALSTNFSIQASKERNYFEVKLLNKNRKFSIYLNQPVEAIIEDVNKAIKGLRKESK